MQEIWNDTRQELRKRLGDDLFQAHFVSFELDASSNESMRLCTTDEMAALIVDKNYRDLVEHCVRQIGGEHLRVDIVFERAQAKASFDVRKGRSVDSTRQLDLFSSGMSADVPRDRTTPEAAPSFGAPSSVELEPSTPRVMTSASEPPDRKPSGESHLAIVRTGLSQVFHFNSFVVGGANEFAYEAARAVVEQPGTLYNPLFIYGGVGLGKTHLMNAIGLSALRGDPTLQVRCISAESFVNELIQSIGAKCMDEFRQRHRLSVDLLLIDDVQFIAGKERTQEEFFHTFNALYQAGRQIVLTSDRIPQEMPELEERLMSRLSMGLLCDIQPPDFETRIAILHKKSRELSFEVPRDVYEYIAQQIRSNVRELHGALLRIGTFARLRKQPISLDLARDQLERVHRERSARVTPEIILKLTAETFGVSIKDLKGRKRVATIATPRKVAMYLARMHAGASYPELGQFFGNRDHTTIMSAVRSVERLIADGAPVRQRIETIERRLG